VLLCSQCVMPDTRPDIQFLDGVCSACIAYRDRAHIDWQARASDFVAALRHLSNGGQYDCIVPSSGGKDSHYQVITLLELGFKPLIVTASTCHLTRIGRSNIDNLKRLATTIEVSPNSEVRAKLNGLGLDLVGDISWPEHVAIFTTPFRVSAMTGIRCIVYGENPQNQYGGPLRAQSADKLTRRWRSEYGGFLGLRPKDMIGLKGISKRDMEEYELPTDARLEGVEALFLGHFFPWDSHANAATAMRWGMTVAKPSSDAWWIHENLDNAQTGIHDYFAFLKYGYTRQQVQMSVDIRAERMDREDALAFLRQNPTRAPKDYGDVALAAILRRIGMTIKDLIGIANKFANPELFEIHETKWPEFKWRSLFA
jgi:N-acetyl sugar amidotransferase